MLLNLLEQEPAINEEINKYVNKEVNTNTDKKKKAKKQEYNGTFPKPLSAEKEKLYINLYENGNPLEQKQAKDILILHNLRLVAHICKKFSLTIKDQEEALSIGTIGLIKGINSFKSSKNVRLSSYASKCIQNELLMWIRHSKKSQNDISIYEPIGSDNDGNEMVILDVITDDIKDFADELDLSLKSKEIYSCIKDILTPREYTVIVLRYGLGNNDSYTQQDIADKLLISRSYISRIEKKALKKLNAHLKYA